MYRPGRKAFALALVVVSLGFHLITVALFTRQPDRFAAFTLFPIWIWGGFGLTLSSVAFLFFRAPLSLFTTGAWALTIFVLADETRALCRVGLEQLEPGIPTQYGGREVIRVATINLAGSGDDPLEAILLYKPDILFIQEIPHPYRLRMLNDQLYQGRGDYRYDKRSRCGVVVRGEIVYQIGKWSQYRSQQVRVKMPNGRRIELINVHLQTASTDLGLWRRDCWRTHRLNRELRRHELHTALQLLEEANKEPRVKDVIIAGDFNAPAGDRVYRQLQPKFIDSFSEAGTGWGNTYHRRFPILRLDHIFVSKTFVPARSRVVTVGNSDHRMVISDLIAK